MMDFADNASALLLYPIVVDLSTTIDGLERSVLYINEDSPAALYV